MCRGCGVRDAGHSGDRDLDMFFSTCRASSDERITDWETGPVDDCVLGISSLWSSSIVMWVRTEQLSGSGGGLPLENSLLVASGSQVIGHIDQTNTGDLSSPLRHQRHHRHAVPQRPQPLA